MHGDLGSLLERSARLDLDGIDFDAFRARPLDADTLRCLRYMHDVESHTVCYLRDLLVTRAHADPAVTGFLACWSYEEHWHGAAATRFMLHLAIVQGDAEGTSATWGDHVTDEEYGAAPALDA